jgi:transposase-like protein
MADPKAASVPRLNAATRKAFLIHLSETANVSASARKVDVGTSSIYAERRRLSDFRAAWTAALAEGYARLEADMLSDALTTASGNTKDATLKARAQKDRLRLALLSMHRASVKAAGSCVPVPAVQEAVMTKENLISKLFKMRSADHRKSLSSDPVRECDHG